jgi:nucleoid-associated protein YgaU
MSALSLVTPLKGPATPAPSPTAGTATIVLTDPTATMAAPSGAAIMTLAPSAPSPSAGGTAVMTRDPGTAEMTRAAGTAEMTHRAGTAEMTRTSGTATMRLVLTPAPAPSPAPPPHVIDRAPGEPNAAVRRWTVQPGDHLWSIARATLADTWHRVPSDQEVDRYWRSLVQANPDLTDPDLLFAGQAVVLPDPAGGR